MYIFGSECSATLVREKELTALPYTLETLREEKEETQLDPLVGYILPLTTIPSVQGEIHILGCVVTRICNNSVNALAAVLLLGNSSPFTIYLNRIAERRIYSSLSLTGFEVRADLEEPLYIRLDVEGKEATDWDYLTPDIQWKQNATLEYRKNDITLNGTVLSGIYRFTLTRINGDSLNTILQLHYALTDDHPLNNARTLNEIKLTFGNRLRFTATKLILLTFDAKTDNAEEILIFRRYRVDGNLLIEVCNDKGEWVTPL